MLPGGQAMFPSNISKPDRTLTLTLMDLPEQMTRRRHGCSEMGPIMPHIVINYSSSWGPIWVIWILLFLPNWSPQCLLNIHSNWAQLHQIVSNKIGPIGVVLWSIEQLTTWTSWVPFCICWMPCVWSFNNMVVVDQGPLKEGKVGLD